MLRYKLCHKKGFLIDPQMNCVMPAMWAFWILKSLFFLLGSKSIIKFKGEPYSPPRVCSRSKVAYWRNYENMSEHFQQWLVYLSLCTFPKTKRTKTKQQTRTKIQTSPWALNSSGKYEFTAGSHFKINSGYAQHKTTVAKGRNPGQWGPVEGTRRALLDKKRTLPYNWEPQSLHTNTPKSNA